MRIVFTEERQSAIEKCLRENGKVKVKELSEMFQVTEDCIRKDLKILENAGKLKKDLWRRNPFTGLSAEERRSRQTPV